MDSTADEIDTMLPSPTLKPSWGNRLVNNYSTSVRSIKMGEIHGFMRTHMKGNVAYNRKPKITMV